MRNATESDNEDYERNKGHITEDHIITVLICAIAIPASMSLWIINVFYSKLTNKDDQFDEPTVISPSRWFAACMIPLLISFYGYRKKSLNLSGAFLGFIVGFVLTLTNLCFMLMLLTFFVSSSKATRFRSHLKRKFEVNFEKGGQRSWIQVLCNGGMATQMALLYLLDVGACERPIDFSRDYRASWLSIGVMGVLACANGDTWASKIGPVLSKSDPFLITTWERVPKGTNGGVSFIGTLVSIAGGLVIGLTNYLAIYYFSDSATLTHAPIQWPVIIVAALAGFLGSLVDSVIGAIFQYSGLDHDGKIVSHSSLSVKHISGKNILDNHSVNLISTVIMGLIIPTISKCVWRLFQ